MSSIPRLLEKLAWATVVVGGLGLMMSMCLGVADVVGTYLGHPVPGAYELTESTMVLVVFGGLTYAQIKRKHIRVELLYLRMPARVQSTMDVIADLAALVFFGLLVWQGWHEALYSYSIDEATNGLIRFPLYPARFCLVFGSALFLVQMVLDLRAMGNTGESLHQYMLYTSEDYKRPNGQMYHTYPSLKTKQDQDALWAGTLDDSIHAIATDEICCTLATKTQGVRIDDTTGGNAAVEPRVSLMYTEMVEKRGYRLEKFVDLVSTNAAKILGLYPRKGAIAAGSDADITVLDPGLRRVLSADQLHETDYTPWEGREVAVWPSLTVLRGRVAVEDGVLHAPQGGGRYLPRKIDPSILSGAKQL